MIETLEKELILLSNKAKYIKENLDGTIDLRKKKKEQVVQMLEDKEYDIIDNDNEYKYLIKMPMDSVTEENVEKLYKEKGNKEVELEQIKITTINEMWSQELEQLTIIYLEYKDDRVIHMSGEFKPKKKHIFKKSVKKYSKIVVEEDD